MDASGMAPSWRRFQDVPRKLQRYGLAGTLWLYAEGLRERWRDRQLGVNTRGYASRAQLGYGQEYNEYEPVTYRSLDLLFSRLRPDPAHDVFLDYGSGLGRAVLTAAVQGFRKAIGVELSPDLCAQARHNVELARGLSCPVEIINEDATRLPVPDDVTMVYLFNPFKGEALRAVLENIYDSVRRRPRPLIIAYQRGSNGSQIPDECSWLQLLADLPAPGIRYRLDRRGMRLRFYRVLPEADSGD